MALHSTTDNEASNQEKAKTKSNQDDKCMIDKLKTISNTTKSGSNKAYLNPGRFWQARPNLNQISHGILFYRYKSH